MQVSLILAKRDPGSGDACKAVGSSRLKGAYRDQPPGNPGNRVIELGGGPG